MITGDHPSTAMAVAKDVGMVRPEAGILLIDAAPQDTTGPAQLVDAEADVGHHETLTSTPSVKARVRFEFDLEQGHVDEGGAAAAAADVERQAPAALSGEGPIPAAPLNEWQSPAALVGERQSPTVLNERQAPAALVVKGHAPAALASEQQAAAAPCNSRLNDSSAVPLEGLPTLTEGLTLVRHADQHSYSVAQATTALAEGQLQCVVTGAGLDHLLQHASPSLVETVMRSAVVFARMRPHQKGQVMALLGCTGLRHASTGQQSRHLAVSLLPLHPNMSYLRGP